MKNFGILVRNYTLLMSVIPIMVALCCAVKMHSESYIVFVINSILIIIGVLCIHMFANLFDDYVDIKKQLKKGLELNQINFRSKRKAKMILNGTYSLIDVKKILFFLVIAAYLIGMYFVFTKGIIILLFMIITILLSAFYPVSTKYGLGEITVGFIFGPVLINSIYYALTGNFNNVVLYLSLAIGLITIVLLVTQSIMEYDFDKSEGKKTLPVIVGSQKNGVISIATIISLSYLFIIIGIFKFNLSGLFYLPIIITLPISYKLVSSLFQFTKQQNNDCIPKFYYGRMENWESIVQNDFAFFMFRFYLARNLSVIFNFTLAIVCFIAFA